MKEEVKAVPFTYRHKIMVFGKKTPQFHPACKKC